MSAEPQRIIRQTTQTASDTQLPVAKPYSIMLVAGEASGDMHAATMVKTLRQQHGEQAFAFKGMGSTQLKACGIDLLVDSSDIAVMGIVEVISHYPKIRRAMRRLQQELRVSPPDLLILIDYQEFNFRLAAFAKRQGIKVLFYVSPQVWAWRPGRVKKIGQIIDMMAVIFPFETRYYEAEQIPVRYVGHPLANKVKPMMSKEQAQSMFSLNPTLPTIAVMPGSRMSEVTRLLPVLLKTISLIRKKLHDAQFILPVAGNLNRGEIERVVNDSRLPIIVIQGATYDAINVADHVILASGTATLEVACLYKPMTVIYKISPITYHLVKKLVNISHFSLVNIVSQKEVVKEFIQDRAQPYLIANDALNLLEDDTRRDQMIEQLQHVADLLNQGDSAANVANLAMDMLQTQTP